MANPRRRRNWPALIIGAVVILAALWAGCWYAAERFTAAAIARAASGPVAGHRLGCAGAALSGFPLRLDLVCQRTTYADAGGRLTAALGGLAASAPLYRPGYVTATITGPLAIDVPARDVALTVSWSDGHAHATAWLSGLTGAGARFGDLDVENGGDATALPLASLKANSANLAIAPLGGGDYRLTGAADHLSLTRSTGKALPAIDTAARLTLVDLGGSLGTDPAATLRRWLGAGATVKLDSLRLAIAGAVFLADGSLTVSPDGLVNGSLLLSYNSIDALANLIETLRPGTRDRYATPLQVLNALSKEVTTREGSFRQTPLTFTDSVIWVGIVPLPDRIPPLKF